MRNDPVDPENSIVYYDLDQAYATQVELGAGDIARADTAGTRMRSDYSGCLDPNAFDYDCAGGSGDGPEIHRPGARGPQRSLRPRQGRRRHSLRHT